MTDQVVRAPRLAASPNGSPSPPTASSTWRGTSRRATLWGRATVVLALAMLTMGVTVSTAWAADAAVGHDVSYPQCRSGTPTGGAFGIVGVNRGRPFSANPCLLTQYRWAAGTPSGAALYVNTSNPGQAGGRYWPRSGSRDPVLCRDSRSTTDPGCAYDYGWHAAQDALATGRTLGGAVLGHSWWLDVETANTWRGNGVSNTAVLQGMYDYLRSHGVAEVGLYSTGSQWRKITGGYTAASAGDYRAAWGASFAPRYPLHAAPLWVATGGNSSTAGRACSTSFTGAPTRMAQYVANGFDTNLPC